LNTQATEGRQAETLATLNTQVTGGRQTETLATLNTQATGGRQTETLATLFLCIVRSVFSNVYIHIANALSVMFHISLTDIIHYK
jgi:hypothetical protein